jgi:myosin heavy subunit
MDLVDCDDISEQAILLELQKRYRKYDIYSAIGPILIAVNPFKFIQELYTTELKNSYVHESIDQLPSYALSARPHVWMVARNAYIQLTQERKPQAIVISGESGG